MSFDKNVFIEAIRGNDSEYVVKDKVGIILGRFFLKDLDSKNKKVELNTYLQDLINKYPN